MKSVKIKRTKHIYKKGNAKYLKPFLFVLLLIILVFLGFIIASEWNKRFSSNNQPHSSIDSINESSNSSEQSSNVTSLKPNTSSQDKVSSIVQPIPDGIVPKTKLMPLEIALDSVKYDKFIAELKPNYAAVMLELKDDVGIIHYNTSNEIAIRYGAVDKKTVNLDELALKCKSNGILLAVKIHTLKDKTAAYAGNENTFLYNNQKDVNWYDNSPDLGGRPWLNPYMKNTRTYISGLTKELVSKGVQVVVLDSVMFPDKNTEMMGMVDEFTTKDEVLKLLVKEAAATAPTAKVVTYADVQKVLKIQ